MPTCFRLVSFSSYAAYSDRKLKAFLLPEPSVRILGIWRWKSVILIKCVCVTHSLAIRQLSKKAVTVAHFEILANVPNQTWPSHVKWLWGGTVNKGGSLVLHCGVLYEFMMYTCQPQAVTSMQNQCYNDVTIMWHQCFIHMRRVTSLQSPHDTNVKSPQWTVQLRSIPLLFVISTITMLFICTSYTVTFYIIQTNIFH